MCTNIINNFCINSFQETPSIFPDRVIAVRGTVEHMSAAEAIISSKLRECFEKDQKNLPVCM